MATQFVPTAALALVVLILASVLGAVTRSERVWFVLGIALFILAHAVLPGLEALAALLAVLGLVVAVGSTVPMLRESV